MKPNGPWRPIPLGTRVTVRARHPQGGYSDAVGHVVAMTATEVTLATRHGERTIQAQDVAIIHVIAGRRPPGHQPGSVDGGGSSLSQT